MMKVLIVEDEFDVAEAIGLSLRLTWPDATVLTAQAGHEGLQAARHAMPDLVLLDLGLPDIDGFDVLKEIRRDSLVPLIVITARGNELDKVRGLETGADDYITKPFGHLELLARVKAVLRRAETPPPGLDRSNAFYDGYLQVDFNDRRVTVGGAPVTLTPTEFNFLVMLVRNAGHIVPHRRLLEHVWGEEYSEETEYLRVYARRLREKIEPDPDTPRYILTERGIGYKFQRPA